MIQSLAISELLVQSLKYATRRERPDESGANSFPSGHAADAFTIATALDVTPVGREPCLRISWPGRACLRIATR